MALVPAVIDVPLGTLDQVPPDTAGPLGRLKTLINCQIRQFQGRAASAGGVIPARVRVEPRDAFQSFTTAARSIIDGSAISFPKWDTPELLNSLGKQLVSIVGSVPRVYNGSTWSYFRDSRVLTQQLTQEVLYTPQRVSQATDSAWMAGVTCTVFNEYTSTAAGPVVVAHIGFRADNKAWVVAPKPLYAPAGNAYTLTKVVSDGSAFWVTYSTTIGTLVVTAYDNFGVEVASISVGRVDASNPGIWDIVASPNGGMVLAQPADVGTDSGVQFTTFSLAGPSIVTDSNVDDSIHCVGPLSWIRSDLADGFVYLGTQGPGEGSGDIWGYQVNPTTMLYTHEYATNMGPGSGFKLDSITGYTFTGLGTGVVLSWSQLPATPASVGPKYDAALRSSAAVQVTNGGAVTLLRTTQSVVQVSRAFKVADDYYAWAYYESGAGRTDPTTIDITPTIGDTFTGAAVQPLAVTAGDRATGSPIALISAPGASGNPNVTETVGTGAVSIAAGDWVAPVTAAGLGNGIPDGVRLWQWRLSALPASGTGYVGSRLTISGSSIAGANTTWDVVAVDTIRQTFYTNAADINGNISLTAGGTFAAAGTAQAISMIGYQVQNLSGLINADTVKPFIGGSVTISGSAFSNGTFTVARVYYGSGFTWGKPSTTGWSAVWVVKTTQTGENHAFTGTLTAAGPNQFTFAAGQFDSTYVGVQLEIGDDPAQPGNVGTYTIVSVQSPTTLTVSATSILPQVFTASGAAVNINLTTQVPYTWAIGAAPADYTFLNAIVSLQGAANPNNDGTYKVVQVNADGSFIATPTNGLSNQVNEAFGPSQTITIFINPSQGPQFQPCWFLMPLSGSQPVAGRIDYGLAIADWRQGGVNPYPMALSSPVSVPGATSIVLPFRSENISSATLEVTSAGIVDLGEPTYTSAAGLKTFTLANETGESFAASGELMLPGPMATTFSGSGSAFYESNVNLAPEQPFLVSQSVASAGQLGLTPGGVYFYVVQFEFTAEDGSRIYSAPSPALQVNMSGDNNVATIGGRLIFPLGSDGTPISNTYGPTTRNVTVSIYRSAFINGENTTQHFKITTDLNPNGLAPISATNQSGFSFPDSFSWTYRDQNSDADIPANEVLLTDKQYLPRYPAPPFVGGVASWLDRSWVIADDGSVWASGPKTEGDAIWWNPVFRWPFPAEDRPLALAAMDGYMLVFCQRSISYIPATQLPDSTGKNGAIPNPVKLPFQNGSKNGFAVTIREGVAYDSTAGGVWLITRNLDNQWLSHAVQDTLTETVVGLSLDSKQRLLVLQQGSSLAHVWDGVPQAWYQWQLPTEGVLTSTYAGEFVYQDTSTVNAAVDAGADVIDGTTYPIAPDLTLAPLNPGNTRGLKRVWEFQNVGTYLGPHNLNVVLSYPEDDADPDTYGPFPANPDEPYVYPFNPSQEEASQYQIRVYADFNGVDTPPGKSFALEMISMQVGMDPIGLNKRPDYVTLKKA